MTVGLVGPIVGPLSGRSLSTGLLVDSRGDYDFAIGGLGFKCAISDKHPYERATAQFRKEQFDSQAQVGDQSLTGWWTRGQLSFHAGAGVRYYEVLDGETVGSRFYDSSDVDVSEPGQVTLQGEWQDGAFALADIIDSTPAGAHSIFLTGAGAVHSTAVGAGTPYAVVGGGTATAVAGDTSGNVFVATSADKIEGTTTALGAGTVLYTHSENIVRLWYAKSRLFLIDALGDLYQLAPNPAAPPTAIAGGDKVCSFVEGGSVDWFLSESPGAVYLAPSSGTVYGITIDADGSLPTLAAPVEVTRLPRGETLVGMGYYLGHLIFQNTASVRLALVDQAGITLGPEILDLDSSGHTRRQVAGVGSHIYVAGDDELASIDLAQPIEGSSLTYAWVTEHEGVDLRGITLKGASLSLYDDTGFYHRSADLATTGWLQTGQHRFGTLEPKQFVSVKVLAEGDGGTIVISRVDQAGNLTSLYTLNLDAATEADITLGLASTAVSMALRFDLNRESASVGPKLLGYQLRALPAPKRQRMIRIPLMLFDSERRQPVRAGGISAWSRLQTLESMEQSGGTFTYQDYRTGESGQCFIEQIEHQGKTPPSAQSKGFGGYIFVTLRVI